MDGHGDGGRRRHRGDGLAVGGAGVGVGRVVVLGWRGRVVGGAASVAGRVFSVAVRAVMAPSLSSSFKSVRARAGWGRDLPVQLRLGVPSVPLSSPGLGPRITTLRGDRLGEQTGELDLHSYRVKSWSYRDTLGVSSPKT